MKVCITGASGFVGTALCSFLAVRDAEVVKAIRGRDASRYLSSGDSCVGEGWLNAVTNCNAVVHLAARVHVMNETTANPEAAFREANVHATLKLANAAAHAGVRRFVYVSSVKVCGESTAEGQPMRETQRAEPQDGYGRSKHDAEEGLRKISMETGLELVIIRPPLVYGPGVKANFASLMRVVAKRWPLPLASVDNRRSMVALDNLVDFIITCIEHPNAANQTFFVSDGDDQSTPDLIRGLAHAMGIAPNLFAFPVSVLQAIATLLGKRMAAERLCGNLQVDISKARHLLQWSPPISVEEGLRRATNGLVDR